MCVHAEYRPEVPLQWLRERDWSSIPETRTVLSDLARLAPS